VVWRRQKQPATRSKNAGQLADRQGRVGNVFNRFTRNDRIEGSVFEREFLDVRHLPLDPGQSLCVSKVPTFAYRRIGKIGRRQLARWLRLTGQPARKSTPATTGL